MKQYRVSHNGAPLSILPADSPEDAIARYRQHVTEQERVKIQQAKEHVAHLEREQKWDAEHPLDLVAAEFS